MLTNSSLYGKGIFTTVAVYDSKPFLWEKHWRRLGNNALTIGIDLSEHFDETTRKALDEIIKKDKVINGRVRITIYDESQSGIWSSDTERKTALQIITGDVRPISENFRLSNSPYPINSRSPLAGVKSCNYLEQIMSLEEAKGRGFDEAVRLNENGVVASACMANIFWLKEGKLYTPSLKTGCLAGTTREFVMENLPCEEVESEIGELDSAEAIYLTSAGLGITAAAEFMNRKLTNARHPILEVLTSN